MRALEITPEIENGNFILVETYLLEGNAEGARRALEAPRFNASHQRYFRLMAERTQMTSSQFDVEVAELILKSGDQPDEVERYEVARLYAMRGDRDRAFVWLERSENEEGGAYNFVRSDPFLRSLHDDPRWEPFLRKVYGRSRE